MRILTGKDRDAYQALVEKAAVAEHLRLHVKLLENIAQELRQQCEAERARANRAVDAQLAVRGFPMVTPPDRGMPDIPDALAEDPEQVAALEDRILRGDPTVLQEYR